MQGFSWFLLLHFDVDVTHKRFFVDKCWWKPICWNFFPTFRIKMKFLGEKFNRKWKLLCLLFALNHLHILIKYHSSWWNFYDIHKEIYWPKNFRPVCEICVLFFVALYHLFYQRKLILIDFKNNLSFKDFVLKHDPT